MTMNEKILTNAMSVDVEDYFQVSAFEPYIDREQWDSLPHRVEANTHRVLDLFAEHEVKATFFTLGWVAERYPGLVHRMVGEGHELASHGYEHTRVTEQTPEAFFADITHTKALLEDLGGVEVRGYRAASYSIVERTAWAFAELERAGYRYSSSVYPIKHDLYGWPEAGLIPFRPPGTQRLIEIPVTALPLFKRHWPAGGGGYFRLLPYPVSRWSLRRINRTEQRSGIFYFHPWEIDPDQPRQAGLNAKTRFRHYLNLTQTEKRLGALLGDFQWDRMDRVFATLTPSDAHRPAIREAVSTA